MFLMIFGIKQNQTNKINKVYKGLRFGYDLWFVDQLYKNSPFHNLCVILISSVLNSGSSVNFYLFPTKFLDKDRIMTSKPTLHVRNSSGSVSSLSSNPDKDKILFNHQ